MKKNKVTVIRRSARWPADRASWSPISIYGPLTIEARSLQPHRI